MSSTLPVPYLAGTWTDFDLGLSVSQGNSWSSRVGMPPFEPQDVSGFDIDTVWTLDRLSQVHAFLQWWGVHKIPQSWFNR
jgi:hypothetical protein